MGELFLELCVHGGLSVVLLPVEELVEASEDYFALLVEDKSSCGAQVGSSKSITSGRYLTQVRLRSLFVLNFTRCE